MSKKTTVIIAATISGLISGYAYYSFNLAPGIIFGVATAIALMKAYGLSRIRAVLWVIASVGSWYAAWLLSKTNGIGASESADNGVWMVILGGFLGAFLLSVANYILVRRDGGAVIPVATVLGGVMAYAMIAGLAMGPGVAFALWQAVIAATLVSDWPNKLFASFK